MDYAKLRNAALAAAEDEEAVTVDTRALIDKVLARYSGEWTTLRELIQNAADAQATTVTIRWETLPSVAVAAPPPAATRSDQLKHIVGRHTIRRLVVRNDGQPFSPTDWGRIKRIAEGNPDETKIGAFGVGFYSVFADCEEPFISSGGTAMAFYWKGNALFTKKSRLPADGGGPAEAGTVFVLDYRSTTTALPSLSSVCRFLATSLTFVALRRIELYVDDWPVLALTKTAAPGVTLAMPPDMNRRTTQRLMEVSAADLTNVQISAEFLSVVGWHRPPAAEASTNTTVTVVAAATAATAAGATTAAASGGGSDGSSGGSVAERPSLRSFFRRLQSAASQPAASALTLIRTRAQNEEAALQERIDEDVTRPRSSTIFLRVISAAVSTKITPEFSAELERATKKPPPRATRLAILTSSYDEARASLSSTEDDPVARSIDVFATVLPTGVGADKKKTSAVSGRIFIGFPTMQTSGAGVHVSAPSAIPTVEREAIDLNARYVRLWNVELLRAAGIATRLAFANEMAELNRKIKAAAAAAGEEGAKKLDGSSDNSEHATARFGPEAGHILATYTFADSTPSGQVGQIMEEAFWTCFNVASIEMYSSQGVLPTTQVRLGSDDVAGFATSIPVVPAEMRDTAFVRKLTEFGLIGPVTDDDVRHELGNRPMSREQTVQFLRWLCRRAGAGELQQREIKALLDVAVCASAGPERGRDSQSGGKDEPLGGGVGGWSEGEGEGNEMGSAPLLLGAIENYLTQGRIPPSLPISPTTIAPALTVGCPDRELRALGWQPLDIGAWVRYLLENESGRGRGRGDQKDNKGLTWTADFAVAVLTVVSKSWEHLSADSRAQVTTMLGAKPVMPTKMGMKLPGESFFPSVRLFDDLPVVVTRAPLREKFLLALGVRKTLDLETIFQRLLHGGTVSASGEPGGGRSSHVEVVRYLVSVRSDIPDADMQRLRESPLCPAERTGADDEMTDAGDRDQKKPKQGAASAGSEDRLRRVSDLYVPNDELRALSLPLLRWPGRTLRLQSDEGRFLQSLGLRPFPDVKLLLEMMSDTQDQRRRRRAMHYFIANHHAHGYNSASVADTQLSIMPTVGGAGSDPQRPTLVRPAACFSEARAAVMGFDILDPTLRDHAAKFGVARDPAMLLCVRRLVAAPPADRKSATAVFEYFATRVGDLDAQCLSLLREARFIPVAGAANQSKNITHVSPQHCYLGPAASSVYSEVFSFVTFSQNADTFLFKCGVKPEPSRAEFADVLCREPARLLSALQTPERYLALLKTLAEPRIRQELQRDEALWARMRLAPFCLASRELAADAKGGSNEDGERGGQASGRDYDEDAPPPAKQYQLAIARDVVIKDDVISYGVFKDSLMCAPEDETLEDFYRALGAQKLSGLVDESVRVGGVRAAGPADAALMAQFRKVVMERSRIFLHQYSRQQAAGIKHDVRWLDQHLRIERVQTLSLRRTFRPRGIVHTMDRSAAATVRSETAATLYIVADREFDMFQVGQSLCLILLDRPSLQEYTTFEPILSLDLYQLRARGYDVDRILRQKEERARVAEEERRRALEEERRRLLEEEQEEKSRAQRQQERERGARVVEIEADAVPTLHNMPGGFGPPSPPSRRTRESSPPAAPQQQRRRKDFFSDWGRRLGLSADTDNDGGADEGKATVTESPAPPGRGPTPDPDPAPAPTVANNDNDDDGHVTNPAVVRQNLHSAIGAARAFGAGTLFSPPRVGEVREQAIYCDAKPATDLVMAAEAANGMRLFLSRDVGPAARDRVLGGDDGDGVAALNGFAGLLDDVASVYKLARSSVHVFYDERGGTIAFNSAGSIFCNLRFYLQLHHRQGGGALVGPHRTQAGVWWWVVLAHELAHNLVRNHDADHSYYTESFVQQYFVSMIALLATWGSARARAGATAGPGPGTGATDQPPPPYSS